MADVAHIIPPSPDDPPRRRSRVRPWHAAVALAVAAAVGGGLWAWKPWQSVELPQSACWGVLDANDLKPLAGPDGKAVEPRPAREIATPMKPASGSRDSRCRIMWPGATILLDAEVRPARDRIDADRRNDASGGSATPLDFGPGTTGWVVDSKNVDGNASVRLYVPCDFDAPRDDSDQPPPKYFGVLVSGDVVDGASLGKAHQAYADIALKIGRAAAVAYECRNTVTLTGTAPRVPS
ncbi:hypothetical protein ACFU7Y_29220 [Kitasatospora sp. NPDC057542]|uniref:hypothetical protein n=1 Tax=Streptomycetaceae TaxID=2062 RepID=UPI001CCB5715|nr:hypothetical protein [Streptomyces sp. LS1784]